MDVILCSSEFSRLIEEQTGIEKISQLILLKDSFWSEQEKLPSTDTDSPLFLFNRDNNNVVQAKDPGARKNLFLFTFVHFLFIRIERWIWWLQ